MDVACDKTIISTLLIDDLKSFQLDDVSEARDVILFSVQNKLIETIYQYEVDRDNIDAEDLKNRLNEMYRREKIEHNGLDIVSYSNMKRCFYLIQLDICLAELETVSKLIKYSISKNIMPNRYFSYYILSLFYRLGGVTDYLKKNNMESIEYSLKSRLLTIIDEIGGLSSSTCFDFGKKILKEIELLLLNAGENSEMFDLHSLSNISIKQKNNKEE
jgi:hypothetical protein